LHIAVIGSGPAGCAAALSLLQRGARVTLFDCGDDNAAVTEELQGNRIVAANAARSIDPVVLNRLSGANAGRQKPRRRPGLASLIGGDIDPSRTQKRILGSDFVFRHQQQVMTIDGADPPVSAAPGGLSNVWGAACYPMRVADFKNWPLNPEDLSPYYHKAADLLGVNANDDGLTNSYPLFGQQTGPRPSTSLSALAPLWQESRHALQASGLDGGYSRLAVGFSDCTHCGLCLFGCPHDLIASSRPWIELIRDHPRGDYCSNTICLTFHEGPQGVQLKMLGPSGSYPSERAFDRVFLAAGTLGSFRIAAQSLNLPNRAAPLLDNDMAVFLNRIGQTRGMEHPAIAPFSLSEMALALRPDARNGDGIHFQFYSFSPYIFGAMTADRFFSFLHRSGLWKLMWPRLAVGFAYLSAAQSRQVMISAHRGEQPFWQLDIQGAQAPINSGELKEAVRRLQAAGDLTQLRPIGPSFKSTPFGFSGHLAGTLPMKERPEALQTDQLGRLADHQRISVVDGAVFPSLAPQNPTLTIVANALRVANLTPL
jgi:choline dehydrogenase-like flavoprotein